MSNRALFQNQGHIFAFASRFLNLGFAILEIWAGGKKSKNEYVISPLVHNQHFLIA